MKGRNMPQRDERPRFRFLCGRLIERLEATPDEPIDTTDLHALLTGLGDSATALGLQTPLQVDDNKAGVVLCIRRPDGVVTETSLYRNEPITGDIGARWLSMLPGESLVATGPAVQRPAGSHRESRRQAAQCLRDWLAYVDMMMPVGAADASRPPDAHAQPSDAAHQLPGPDGDTSRRPMSFDVFLSYNSDDRLVVEQLAKKLEEGGLTVWMDKENLVSGGHWQDGIGTGIDCSSSLAVCIGPTEIGPWQKEEIQYALIRAARDPKFAVMPVLLPGAPDEPKLPFPLANRHSFDFRSGITDERVKSFTLHLERTLQHALVH